MKKKVVSSLVAFVMILASSVTAFAAPEIMPDGGMFDAEYYAQNNPDVVQVFGNDKELLYSHYVNAGRAEGRLAFQITESLYTTCPVASAQTLELLASGGTKGVHYKADGNYRCYRLGDTNSVWGEFAVTRTDFPDGLIDMDGNGLDDRDPINSLGYVDLNLNGIDDRNITLFGSHTGKKQYESDLEIHGICKEERFEYDNYLCVHGIVCKVDNNVEKLCLTCRAIEAAEKVEYARRHSGHVSEDKGYQIGSQVKGYSGKNEITLTYQGNDVWIGSGGYTWTAYLDKNDRVRWDGGIR